MESGTISYTGMIKRTSKFSTFVFKLVMTCLLLQGCGASSNTVNESVTPESSLSSTQGSGLDAGYTVVDCLLPGQIRRLGTQVTYLTARRPIRTTEDDCAIRGGEYTAADRADYQTALKIWHETAQEGNPQAQYYVGSLYEKGPKGRPDYALAGVWYQKAAHQGHRQAAMNLGRLYEKGLGVTQSSSEAFKWYAKASGLDKSGLAMLINQDHQGRIKKLESTVQERDRQIRHLQTQIHKATEELTKLRKELQQRSSLANEERSKLTKLKSRYSELQETLKKITPPTEKVQGLSSMILKSPKPTMRPQPSTEGRTEEHQKEVASLKDRLLKGKKQIDHLQAQLKQLQASTKQERDQKHESEQHHQKRISELKDELVEATTQHQTVTTQFQHEMESLREKLDHQARLVQERDTEVTQLQQQVAALEKEKEQQARELEAAPVVDLGFAGPTIEVIDPPVVLKRGIRVVKNTSTPPIKVPRTKHISGRVVAPAGLKTLTVNGELAEVDPNGIFMMDLPPFSPDQDTFAVEILAIDIQNKRAATKLLLTRGASGLDAPQLTQEEVDAFGNYYALVIGNNNYQHWSRLTNAVADAEAVANILRGRYGFHVTLLKDATRKDILKALNSFHKKLKKDDNLLVYYAGHGHLEKKIDRGYWIPVDAERDDNSEWILTPTITDLLELMSAKHVLVVADSCFAGKLTRSSLAKLRPGLTEEARLTMLKTIARKRVRTALTSGGEQPVMDAGGEGHSVFTEALLGVLKENTIILETERLFWAVRTRVVSAASKYKMEQVPTYWPIQFAGHESLGDFIFVPKTS